MGRKTRIAHYQMNPIIFVILGVAILVIGAAGARAAIKSSIMGLNAKNINNTIHTQQKTY